MKAIILLQTKHFILLLFILASVSTRSQVKTDSVVYDIDGIIYKKLLQGGDTTNSLYFDIQGNQRVVYQQKDFPIGNDKMRELFKVLGKGASFPGRYRREAKPEDYTSTLVFIVSFLIEKDGSITNLRAVGDIDESIRNSELFPADLNFPNLGPALDSEGNPIVVEVNEEFAISCSCAQPIKLTAKEAKRREKESRKLQRKRRRNKSKQLANEK